MRRYGESKQHEKAKEKVADTLRACGYTVYIDSYPFKCQTEKGERTYWPDIYAESPLQGDRRENILVQAGIRRLIIEVLGFRGHKSRAAFQADRLRIQDIRTAHGNDIEYYTVSLNRRKGPMDVRTWGKADILEHLQIQIVNKEDST